VADSAKAALKMDKLSVNYVATPIEQGFAMIESGSVDVLCGAVTDTLARRERVSFSLPIYNGGLGVLLRADAPETLTRVLSGKEAHEGPKWRASIRGGLADHVFAVHTGTTSADWVRRQFSRLRITAKIVDVEDHAQGVEMVKSQKADAYFADRSILVSLASSSGDSELIVSDRYFTFEPLALAVARNDDDFRLLVDRALSELYNSGDFSAVYGKYFGEPGESIVAMFKLFTRQ
jgi:polar amino acid transport system substrate-binding protein